MNSLVNGESVAANINEDVSFDEISARHSPENMLGLLYSAGYLTSVGRTNDNVPILKIPNAEIQECFERKIEFYVKRSTYSSNNGRDLLRSFGNFDRINATRILNSVLNRYASVRDSGYESFYHGFVLGLITSAAPIDICRPSPNISALTSNAESGNGYSDIRFVFEPGQAPIIIGIKRSVSEEAMLADSEAALRQIHEKNYPEIFRQTGYKYANLYGIAFFQKQCRLTCERMTL